jgi:predicted metal-dependent enzyme (double-stranded beta helix superfamily)
MTASAGCDPRLLEFAKQAQQAALRGDDEFTMTTQIAQMLRHLLDVGFAIPAKYKAPKADHYVMYPLWASETISIACAVWGVGQSTPVHDHGTWGVVGIYDGSEYEIRYDPPAGETAMRQVQAADWQPGSVTVCCTSDRDLHSVACSSSVACVGIHVYGADIGAIQRHAYDPATGVTHLFRSAWGSAPLIKRA